MESENTSLIKDLVFLFRKIESRAQGYFFYVYNTEDIQFFVMNMTFISLSEVKIYIYFMSGISLSEVRKKS